MKLWLLVLALDCLLGIVAGLLVLTLKRNFDSITTFLYKKTDARRPHDLPLREILDYLTKCPKMLRSQPAWAAAQGLTLLEELQARRYFNELLLHYCGSDDLCTLTFAMRQWRGLSPDVGVGQDMHDWERFVSAAADQRQL